MTSKITYVHEELTKIDGTPDAATIQQLRKQVYTNLLSIPSIIGGANNGYLGLAMPAAEYLARAGAAFVHPPAPQAQPVHAAGDTAAIISAANRLWDENKDIFRQYTQVKADVRQQIIKAVDPVYFVTLEDPLFGFADVTLDAETLEKNRDKLKEPWNLDEPFEHFWLKIKTIRAVATSGNQAITDFQTMSLAQTALRQSGVYDHATSRWYDRPDAEKTWANFVVHFNHHEKKRKESLTAQAAGFHGANHATGLAPVNAPPGTHLAAAATAPLSETPPNAFQMTGFYCWSHGLSTQAHHTSATCNNKREGHMDDATGYDCKGGTQKFNFGRNSNTPSRRIQRNAGGT
jgi:hypothetical protein